MESGGAAVLARWTQNWDCGKDTGWYYCIKDTPLDIHQLKAKRRYEIRKGNKHFSCKMLSDPAEYLQEIFAVQVAAFEAYPKSYRPQGLTMANLKKDIAIWKQRKYLCFGAFSSTGGLCGYSVFEDCGRYMNFLIQKTRPDMEKSGVNAALVYGALMQLNERFKHGFYLVDGERPVNHETHFQDYLIKYFGFRKAYCSLHIAYPPSIRYILRFLFPLRKAVSKLKRYRGFHQVDAVLRMEEIARKNREADCDV